MIKFPNNFLFDLQEQNNFLSIQSRPISTAESLIVKRTKKYCISNNYFTVSNLFSSVPKLHIKNLMFNYSRNSQIFKKKNSNDTQTKELTNIITISKKLYTNRSTIKAPKLKTALELTESSCKNLSPKSNKFNTRKIFPSIHLLKDVTPKQQIPLDDKKIECPSKEIIILHTKRTLLEKNSFTPRTAMCKDNKRKKRVLKAKLVFNN